MMVILVLFWPFVLFIIWFLESYLGCKMDDCLGGYDEFTVWQRIKKNMKTDKKNFKLVRFESIRDEDGNTKDWVFTIVATGRSESSLMKYMTMKGLTFEDHIIDYVGPRRRLT